MYSDAELQLIDKYADVTDELHTCRLYTSSIYDASVVDEIIPVPDDEAIRGGRELI